MLTALAHALTLNTFDNLVVCGIVALMLAVTIQPNHQGASLPQHGFVRLPTIPAVFPISRSSWWAGVKVGRYPPPVKLGPRTTAWRVEDIRTLVERLGRDTSQGPLPWRTK
jgi:prophage regulatory protein